MTVTTKYYPVVRLAMQTLNAVGSHHKSSDWASNIINTYNKAFPSMNPLRESDVDMADERPYNIWELPEGHGFDGNWSMAITGQYLNLYGEYHVMTNGFYDGWVEFVARFPLQETLNVLKVSEETGVHPVLPDFKLTFINGTGRYVNELLRDYIYEAIAESWNYLG